MENRILAAFFVQKAVRFKRSVKSSSDKIRCGGNEGYAKEAAGSTRTEGLGADLRRPGKGQSGVRMDGFGYIGGEKNSERKKLVKAGRILAWVALILMWAVLAARSIVVMGWG